jgi:hypothetical protein
LLPRTAAAVLTEAATQEAAMALGVVVVVLKTLLL